MYTKKCGHSLANETECDVCEGVMCMMCSYRQVCAQCGIILCEKCTNSPRARVCNHCGEVYGTATAEIKHFGVRAGFELSVAVDRRHKCPYPATTALF